MEESMNSSGTQKAKKLFKVPHTFVIILGIVLVTSILTWIVPAGEFARVENAQGIKVVVPDQFSYIEKTPVNPLRIPNYVIKGFESSASLIFMVIISGGAFNVLVNTGALQVLIAKVVKKFGSKEAIFIPVLLLLFAAIATTQSVTVFIGFTPVIIMMARAMGFDSITGAALPLLGGAIGFSTGTLNTSTTIVAQKIADLPLYSGIGYRFFCLFVFWIITSIALVQYARKVRATPTLSPMYDLDSQTTVSASDAGMDDHHMDLRKILCLLTLVGCLVVLVWGCVTRGWDLPEISVVFIWLALLSGICAGFGPSKIATHFAEGCKRLTVSALILGLARATSGVLSAAHILDTIVYGCTLVLKVFPSYLRGMCMYWVNFLINALVTSGSGQAAVVMPIFTPVADMVGITRQTSILAFNFGDGFCNYILPMSTALMGNLSVANIPYDRWMRFMWRICLIWIVTGSVLVFIAQMIHLGPM